MTTQIMGILNVTPDSFFDQSRYFNLDQAIERGLQLAKEGADILDIGGESTRPGALPVSEQDELDRVIPVIQGLKKQLSIPLSIDTMKPKIAEAAIEAGASLINDVSGFRDPVMLQVACATQASVCVMHMNGTPQTMQMNPTYPQGLIPFLTEWFTQQIDRLLKAGVQEKNIILDPGIGFGKSLADNVEILHNLHRIKALGFPVLVGTSRKAFLQKTLQKPTAELLPATLAVNTLAILAQTDIIRVHDVSEHRDVVTVMKHFQSIRLKT